MADLLEEVVDPLTLRQRVPTVQGLLRQMVGPRSRVFGDYLGFHP